MKTLSTICLLMIWFCLVASEQRIAKTQSNSRPNGPTNGPTNGRTTGRTNGGIYFSDIPMSDAEGSADGSDDDLEDNASGKGEDDEDTKDVVDKEGSGDPLKASDEDLDLGSGDESLFISSTERPTKRPDVSKTSEEPPKELPKESKEPKKSDSLPDPIEENRVPIDVRPPVATPETSTKFVDQSSTDWSNAKDRERDRDRGEDDNGLSNEVSIMGQKQVTPASFFARPGILAAVIGGAVVGLLCAILLVMFIVYRMRKKDEGSYALDEPKRSTSNNPYARGASKEFYA